MWFSLSFLVIAVFLVFFLFFKFRESTQRANHYKSDADRLTTIFDNMLETCLIVDSNGNILYANHEAARNKYSSRNELTGKNIREVLLKFISVDRVNDILKYLKSHAYWKGETELLYEQGIKRWFELSLQPVLEGMMILGRDITDKKIAEENLRISEEQFATAFESNPNAISITRIHDGLIIELNKTYEEITGYNRNEIIGRSSLDLGIFTYKTQREELIRLLQEKGRLENVEIEIKNSKGELKYVILSSVPINVHTQECSLNIMLDVTERKLAEIAREKAENELRESELRYKLVTENGNDVIWLFDLKENRFVYVSPSVYKLRGYTVEEVMQQAMPDSMTAESFSQIAELLPLRIAAFLNGDESCRTQTHEVDQTCKDGSIVPTEVVTTLITDANHNVVQIQGVSRNISERKAAEKNLFETVELLRIMGKTAKVGGWELNPVTGEGKWTEEVARIHDLDESVEPNRDLGYSFYTSESVEIIKSAVNDAINSGIPYDLELEIVSALGIHKWIRTICNPEMKDGKTVRLKGSFQDISEIKKIRDEIEKLNSDLEQRVAERTSQLESANKELESFSYSVSHDLRAPLRHISGYVDLLTRNYLKELPEKGKHYMQSITDATHQMSVLIDDLLSFSRTTRQVMKKSYLDMNDLFAGIIKESKFDAKDRKINWHLHPLPGIHADHGLLKTVCENLLSNALKFTRNRQDAVIEIGYTKDGNESIFYIKDNGAGFDMEYAHKLFGVFQRLHSSEEYEGTGIGLANVHKIVTRHGGRVWAEGKIDEGATFYFSIPDIHNTEQ